MKIQTQIGNRRAPYLCETDDLPDSLQERMWQEGRAAYKKYAEGADMPTPYPPGTEKHVWWGRAFFSDLYTSDYRHIAIEVAELRNELFAARNEVNKVHTIEMLRTQLTALEEMNIEIDRAHIEEIDALQATIDVLKAKLEGSR